MSQEIFLNEFTTTMEHTENALATLIQRPNQTKAEIDRLSEKLRGAHETIGALTNALVVIDDQRYFEAFRGGFDSVSFENYSEAYREGMKLVWSKTEALAYEFLPTANEA